MLFGEDIMWDFFKRPQFVVLIVAYAMFILGYFLWFEVRDVYAVTNKQEIARLAEQTSILRTRIDQSEAPLKDTATSISTLIDKKSQK
jgi:hypothetical protein